MITRRKFMCGSAGVATLAMGGLPLRAQDYPSDVIHIVVPWGAGGGTDSIARSLALAMQEAGGASIVVDNISGASGATGSLQVAQAEPNGYTVLLNGSMDLNAPLTFQDLPFSLDDYAYVGGCYVTPTWILSHSDRGYGSLQDLIQRANDNPGQVTVGVAGAVGGHAIVAHAIKGITGAEFRIVPYQGGVDLRRAGMADEVDAVILHAPVLLAEVEEGMIDVIATCAPLDRITYEPVRDTPTLKDLGIDLEFRNTRGLFLPAGTPEERRATLEGIMRQATLSDRFAEFGRNFGFDPVWLTGDEFEEHMRAELALFREVKSNHIDS